MQLRFWGVRGDIAVPGPTTLKYGGHTSCITVTDHKGNLCILDAGSGLIPLGRALLKGEFGRGKGKALFLLSCGHWDHTQGIGFFNPFYIRGNRFTFFGAGSDELAFYDILESQLSPALSPLHTLTHLEARLAFRESEGKRFTWGDFQIQPQQLPIRSGQPHNHNPLAYRITTKDRSLVYIPIAEYPAQVIPAEVINLSRGADTLIHEAYHVTQGQQLGSDHCSADLAVELAQHAGIPRLVLFHYRPEYDDDRIDQLISNCRIGLSSKAPSSGTPVEIIAAQEGLELSI